MIQALVTDFGRVLLFPADENYTGLLNDLHEKLLQGGDYDFWSYFHLNDELLNYYDELSSQIDVYIFTTRHIQEYPPIAEKLKGIFKGVISAARLSVNKETPEAYEELASLIGFQPEEIIFVDDSPAKLKAAAKAGLHCIDYQTNEQLMDEIDLLLEDYSG